MRIFNIKVAENDMLINFRLNLRTGQRFLFSGVFMSTRKLF